VLKSAELREIYDKTEQFVGPKKAKKIPTEGQRYMSAFSEATSYSVFIIMTLLFVQQHQQFAKQMTIGLLLVFSSCSVQLKMPKEVNADENVVIQAMNFLPLDRYCYFEIAYLVKMLYPSLFNLTLNISRLVDAEPSVLFKQNILRA